MLWTLRRFVRDLYGDVTLVVFDNIVKNSSAGSGMLEQVIAMQLQRAHIALVRAACSALEKGGFIYVTFSRMEFRRVQCCPEACAVNVCT